ncbi:leader peptidase (prepilin peptidase)/N-methyltransferase [Isoptericola jiangsuensis]|uniref:Leader peptidase (Prepilin peptidase)/N-methyltransferase n=1 Tax=Isoptericola jiangsuensis TaxID=548579 RepID=A0A2A9EZ16_9MICO|nr:leader peptidase (prepilin peptidase)/N-methyltransferase [Isoptericola jiangsuensis]
MTSPARTPALVERIVSDVRPNWRSIAVWGVVAVVWATWLTGPGWSTPVFVVAAVAGAALGVIDGRDHRLPDAIVYPTLCASAVLLVAGAAVTGAWGDLARAGLCAAAFGVAFLGLSLVGPWGLGLGDVKLAVLLGMLAGWQGWQAALWAGVLPFLLGGIVAAGLLISRRATRQSMLPFGPFMLVGAAVAMTWTR